MQAGRGLIQTVSRLCVMQLHSSSVCGAAGALAPCHKQQAWWQLVQLATGSR